MQPARQNSEAAWKNPAQPWAVPPWERRWHCYAGREPRQENFRSQPRVWGEPAPHLLHAQGLLVAPKGTGFLHHQLYLSAGGLGWPPAMLWKVKCGAKRAGFGLGPLPGCSGRAVNPPGWLGEETSPSLAGQDASAGLWPGWVGLAGVWGGGGEHALPQPPLRLPPFCPSRLRDGSRQEGSGCVAKHPMPSRFAQPSSRSWDHPHPSPSTGRRRQLDARRVQHLHFLDVCSSFLWGAAAGRQSGFIALVFPVNLFDNSQLEFLDGLQGARRGVPATRGTVRQSVCTAFAEGACPVCNGLAFGGRIKLGTAGVLGGAGVRPHTAPSSPPCSPPHPPHTWHWGERCRQCAQDPSPARRVPYQHPQTGDAAARRGRGNGCGGVAGTAAGGARRGAGAGTFLETPAPPWAWEKRWERAVRPLLFSSASLHAVRVKYSAEDHWKRLAAAGKAAEPAGTLTLGRAGPSRNLRGSQMQVKHGAHPRGQG